MRGIVVKYNKERGFGFIRPAEKDRSKFKKDLFVHISDVEGKVPLIVGQHVKFDVVDARKGPQAVNVTLGFQASSPTALSVAVIIVTTAPVMLLTALALRVPWVWSYLIAINITTFSLYAYDKAAAPRDFTRVPEPVFQALHLLGGSPLALVGQLTLRHKTRKTSFQLYFWGIFIVQLIAVALYLWLW